MPRYQRAFLKGYPLHIVQRGHDRKAVFACVRYIEMNPVKAGMVENPGDYEWSSYRERTGIADARDGVACLPENDQAELARCYGDPSEVNLEPRCDNGDVDRLIQTALARNQLTGASHFYAEIERKLERRLSSLPPGRPRRVGDEK